MKTGVLSDAHSDRDTKELRWIYDQYLANLDIILHMGDYGSLKVVQF
jgi:predicted phosphodiesterase